MTKSKSAGYVLDNEALEQIGLDFEIDLFETTLAVSPDNEEVLFALGNAYTRRGHLENGLEVDARLVQISPLNPIYCYNLACSLSLLGRVNDALRALEQAVHLGFDDHELLTRDPDLSAVKKNPRYEVLVHKLQIRKSH